MKFLASALAATLAISSPLNVTAFSTAGFSRSVVNPGTVSAGSNAVKISNKHSAKSDCPCPGCVGSHSASCVCFSCSGGFALRMSDTAVEEVSSASEAESIASEVVAPDEEAIGDASPEIESIPSEVVSLDGVATDEEAHNVDRPARVSGIHKHSKDDDRKKRTSLADLEIGSTVEGTVKTITAYGAFLDIGARSDALLHISRLSDDFVANVEDVVKQGDKVSVRIVTIDSEKNQIAVTMRSAETEARAAEGQNSSRPTKRRERPQRSGGDQASQAKTITAISEKGFDESKFVDGEVVSILAFGAFVRFDSAQLAEGLEGEVDGLVHISALAEGRTGSVADVVTVGDKVQVRIREVDVAAGRISLSMITQEQEETSKPAQRERKERGGDGGRRAVDAVSRSWKDMGAADWKETMDDFTKEQPVFTNTAVIVDRRK